MIVVGGSYEEICRDPERSDLIGSGLRAAIALRAVAGEVTLFTALDQRTLADAETLAGGAGVKLEAVERSEPVGFVYATPLSAPIVSGPRATVNRPISVEADVALVFGMIEAERQVHAKRAIFDPQQPKDLAPLASTGIETEHLALVANAAETRSLAGGSRILDEAARELRSNLDADVVVTKAGARGALVTTDNHQEWIGPHPTREVWPIGSGDVFAAGFAWAWGMEGAHPVEAARAASMAAAHWVLSERLDLPAEAFKVSPSAELSVHPGRVYLAGPFFSVSERWLINLVHESLRTLGGTVFSPMHDVGPGHEVAQPDLEGLKDSSVMLALLDGDDPGTLFEVGWARKAGIPVVGFGAKPHPEGIKMLVGTDVTVVEDLASAVYQALWVGMGANF